MTTLLYLVFVPVLILVGFVLFDFIQHIYDFLEMWIESSFIRILIIALTILSLFIIIG